MSQLFRTTSKQRQPPPSLFLHPSPGASNISLPIIPPPVGTASASTAVGAGTGSGLKPSASVRGLRGTDRDVPASGSGGGESRRGARAGMGGLPVPLPSQLRRESTRGTDRTDALWAEMQATLEEVELSASGGTRVFGPEHDAKLAGLRAAQIALAQAWARSEADDAIETTLAGGITGLSGFDQASRIGAGSGTGDAGDDGARSTAGASSARPTSSGIGAAAKLEEETHVDIVLARKRREANDRYFERVNQGVLDVVAKLEDVSVAMRAVEQESKEVWGDEQSVTDNVKV